MERVVHMRWMNCPTGATLVKLSELHVQIMLPHIGVAGRYTFTRNTMRLRIRGVKSETTHIHYATKLVTIRLAFIAVFIATLLTSVTVTTVPMADVGGFMLGHTPFDQRSCCGILVPMGYVVCTNARENVSQYAFRFT
jgi:hypothetical protein